MDGNLSGVTGDGGEKSLCLFNRGGGVSPEENRLIAGRLDGEGLGVTKPA